MSDLPPPPPEFEPGSSEPPPPPDPSSHAPQAMTGRATLGTGERVELASPGARLGARLLDIVIMAVILGSAGKVLFFGASSILNFEFDERNRLEPVELLGVGLLFALVGIVYEVTMIALKGQTVGKMATSVKVIRADNGQLPRWGKSIARWIIPTLLYFIPVLLDSILALPIPFIGWVLALLCYVSLTWDKVRQGWHDKAAATLVVKV